MGFVKYVNNKYYLISKVTNIPYFQYKRAAVRLANAVPFSVDEIIVGVENNPKIQRKVITYKDAKGNMLERVFDYTGEALKDRMYSYTSHNMRMNLENVRTSQIKEYSLPRKFYNKFLKKRKGKKFDFWTPEKVETHHVSTNKYTHIKVHSMTRITDINTKTPTHTIIEFPHYELIGDAFIELTDKKILQYKVNKTDGTIVSGSQFVQNALMPKNDSYLGYRILGIEDFINPITQRMVRLRGLKDMDVNIGRYCEKEKSGRISSAHFTPWNGVIGFNRLFKHSSKGAVVNTARHETEHAWQYYLDARNGCNSDSWGLMIQRRFGDLSISPKLQREATSYSKSIANYVSFKKDFKAYNDSLIESLARKAGESERDKYICEAQELRQQFRYIPEELL